jgi:cytochrome P450
MMPTHMAALYPPRVSPAKKPLRFPINLFKLLSNNLEIVPEQAYDEEVVLARGPPRMAFITGPNAVETVLKTRHDDFPKGRLQNEVLEPLMGNAMVSSHGKEWRWQRGAAAPLFRHDELMRYVPVMSDSAERTIENWRTAPEDEYRPINRDMMRATFGIISQTLLCGGADDVIASIEKGHAEYFRRVNWWVLNRMLRLPSWLPRPGGRAMRRHEHQLHVGVRGLVRDRQGNADDGTDLLSRLLVSKDPETGRVMSKERLVNNIIAFLVAGYDTTALALTWTLFLIAQSPEWSKRMRAEVDRVAGARTIGPEHLEGLVVVEQVLKESLRLYPTAPIIVRDFFEDVVLEGVHVPTGTIGIIPIYAIHRHRGFWREPDLFDPSRFAPDAVEKPNRYQYLPFGVGPRICIGAAFATIEAKVMLATFIRAADFELLPGFSPRPTGQMFLTAAGDIPMRVQLRK